MEKSGRQEKKIQYDFSISDCLPKFLPSYLGIDGKWLNDSLFVSIRDLIKPPIVYELHINIEWLVQFKIPDRIPRYVFGLLDPLLKLYWDAHKLRLSDGKPDVEEHDPDYIVHGVRKEVNSYIIENYHRSQIKIKTPLFDYSGPVLTEYTVQHSKEVDILKAIDD
jgi:hypothetical protein